MRGKIRKNRRALVVLVLLLAMMAGMFFVTDSMNSMIVTVAEARGRQLAVRVVNEAANQSMSSRYVYSDFVKVSTDKAGNVQLLSINTVLLNSIASMTTVCAQEILANLPESGLDIPFGSALGVAVFSGLGPKIHVSIMPIGSVTTDFVSTFESAGINQTRHQIAMEAEIQLRIVAPRGVKAATVTVKVPIAESILVGEVPDSYIEVPDTSDALNFAP